MPIPGPETLKFINKIQAERDTLIVALDMAQAALRNDMYKTRVITALSIIDEALADVEIPEPDSE